MVIVYLYINSPVSEIAKHSRPERSGLMGRAMHGQGAGRGTVEE
jgi:hypothetical protein